VAGSAGRTPEVEVFEGDVEAVGVDEHQPAAHRGQAVGGDLARCLGRGR
jgi:hypothetical protein